MSVIKEIVRIVLNIIFKFTVFADKITGHTIV